MQAARIFETCLCGRDLPAIRKFYTEVMGLEVVGDMNTRGIVFRCGEGVLIVFNPDETKLPSPSPHHPHEIIPPHGTEGVGHIAFLATTDELPSWRAQLTKHGVQIISEVNWTDGGTSIYFHDPAGNVVELAPPTLWGFSADHFGKTSRARD